MSHNADNVRFHLQAAPDYGINVDYEVSAAAPIREHRAKSDKSRVLVSFSLHIAMTK
jgi:hypothetical protein